MSEPLEVYSLADVSDMIPMGAAPGRFYAGEKQHPNVIDNHGGVSDVVGTDALLSTLRGLQDMQAGLERKGADIEALQNAERILACQKELRDADGLSVAALETGASKLCVLYNKIGTKCFKGGKYDLASNLFARCMKLTDADTGAMYFAQSDHLRTSLRSTTLNNIGCMERRRGRNDAALQRLRECSALENHSSPATNLNISAILTQLGRHAEAVGTARRAIGLLNNKQEKTQEDCSLLVIAYHNLAMAQECSPSADDRADAKASYAAAVDTATRTLGEGHPTTVSVIKSLQRAHRQAKKARQKRRPPPPPPQPQQSQSASQVQALQERRRSRTHSKPDALAQQPTAQAPTLPNISPLSSAVAAPCSPQVLGEMMTAEKLQEELNPGYTGETGMILADQNKPPRPRTDSNAAAGLLGVGGGSLLNLSAAAQQQQHGGAKASTGRVGKRSKRGKKASHASLGVARHQSQQHQSQQSQQQPQQQPQTQPPGGVLGPTAADHPVQPQQPPQQPPPAKERHVVRKVDSFVRPPQKAPTQAAPPLPPQHQPQPPQVQPQPPASSSGRPNNNKEPKPPGQPPPQERAPRSQPHPPLDGASQQVAAASKAGSDEEKAKEKEKEDEKERAEKAKEKAVERGVKKKRKPEQGATAAASAAAPAPAPPPEALADGRRRGRGMEDAREEDKRKEDAVAYMHQLLLKLLREEDVYEQQFQAALRIQCMVRCSAAHATVEQLKELRHKEQSMRLYRENDSAKIVTRFIRQLAVANISRRKHARVAQVELDRRNRAAVSIQRGSRGWLARRRTKWLRTYYQRVNWCTLTLQCFFRRIRALKDARRRKAAAVVAWQAKLSEERLSSLATKVQKVYRGYRARVATSALRGRIKRQIALDGDSLRQHAATRISAWWHGARARRRTVRVRKQRLDAVERRELIERRSYSATIIQCCFRRYAAALYVQKSSAAQHNRIVRSRYEKCSFAALRLQLFVRCAWARSRASELRSEREARIRRQKDAHAATVIAGLWRTTCARAEAQCRRAITTTAATRHRGEQTAAATQIQRGARGWLARRRYAQTQEVLALRLHAQSKWDDELHAKQEAKREKADNLEAEWVRSTQTSPAVVGSALVDTPLAASCLPYLEKLSKLAGALGMDCYHLRRVLEAPERAKTLPIVPCVLQAANSPEGVVYSVLLQDHQRVLYIDGVFARVLQRVTWNADTRYITLGGTSESGSDTVQVLRTPGFISALEHLEVICCLDEQSGLVRNTLNSGAAFVHNVRGAADVERERCITAIQSGMRAWRQRRLVCALRRQVEADLQADLREQAAVQIQAWQRRLRARAAFDAARHRQLEELHHAWETEASEYVDSAAKTITGMLTAKMMKSVSGCRPAPHAATPPVQLTHNTPCDAEWRIEGASRIDFLDSAVVFDVSKFLALSPPQTEEEKQKVAAGVVQRVFRGHRGRVQARREYEAKQYSSLRPLQKARLAEQKMAMETEALRPDTAETARKLSEAERNTRSGHDEQRIEEDAHYEHLVNENARRFLTSLERGSSSGGSRPGSGPPHVASDASDASSPTQQPRPPSGARPPGTAARRSSAASSPSPTPGVVAAASPEPVESLQDVLQRTRAEVRLEEERLVVDRAQQQPGAAAAGSPLATVSGIDFSVLEELDRTAREKAARNPATRQHGAATLQAFARSLVASHDAARRAQMQQAALRLRQDELRAAVRARGDEAATRIQSAWRVKQAKEARWQRRADQDAHIGHVLEVEGEEWRDQASVKIQQQARGHMACTAVRARQRSLSEAVERSADSENQQDRAAVLLQRYARARASACVAAVLRGARREEEAAASIQRSYRRHAACVEKEQRRAQRTKERNERVGGEVVADL